MSKQYFHAEGKIKEHYQSPDVIIEADFDGVKQTLRWDRSDYDKFRKYTKHSPDSMANFSSMKIEITITKH